MSHADTLATTVREYKSRHDAIGDLPLVTDTARVTHVEKMDQDRREEVTAAIKRWLADAELTGRYGSPTTPQAWRQLQQSLADGGQTALARRIATLIDRYERPKPMLVQAQFQTGDAIDYLAGQYIGLRYDGTSRAYSLASSPTQDHLEICVRRVPGGRLSPRICDDLSVGDEVTVRGPYGELVLQDPGPHDIVFLATGTGVAPFKGMIEYLFDAGYDEYRGTQRDIWLFLGAAWRDDLPYRDAFRTRHEQHDNFHFVPCLSREPVLAEWDGETDYVQHALLKHTDADAVTAALDQQLDHWLRKQPDSDIEKRLDPSNMEVYACGLNAMVYSLVAAVEHLGVPPSRIESEGFG